MCVYVRSRRCLQSALADALCIVHFRAYCTHDKIYAEIVVVPRLYMGIYARVSIGVWRHCPMGLYYDVFLIILISREALMNLLYDTRVLIYINTERTSL